MLLLLPNSTLYTVHRPQSWLCLCHLSLGELTFLFASSSSIKGATRPLITSFQQSRPNVTKPFTHLLSRLHCPFLNILHTFSTVLLIPRKISFPKQRLLAFLGCRWNYHEVLDSQKMLRYCEWNNVKSSRHTIKREFESFFCLYYTLSCLGQGFEFDIQRYFQVFALLGCLITGWV